MVLTAVAVLVAIGVVQLIRNYPYSSGSPAVRVTVAGGCPQSLGQAVDVSNPGPSWWHELWHRGRLASSGATKGLVCEYADAALKRRVVMSAARAAAVSAAAHDVSTKRPPSGTYHCPSDQPGHVAIVVLGYPSGTDIDIWWKDTGCQSADNGHVQVFQAVNDSFAHFQDAVDAAGSGPLG